MAGTLVPWLRQQFLSNAGDVLASGTVETYEAGTSTPLATYSDSALSVTNGTTLTLNSAGVPQVSGTEVAIFLLPRAYKFIIKNSAGSTIFTKDNITALQAAGAGNLDITGTAGEALAANDLCYLSDGSNALTAGRWYKADADFSYASLTPQIGFATAAIASGASGTIRVGGVADSSGLTAGTSYYVSATAGQLTSTAPMYARLVGQASSTTALAMSPNPPPRANTGSAMVLLYANSGTNTSAAAANVDTLAISGLTAKDTLVIVANTASVTQQTADVNFYNSTDAVSIASVKGDLSAIAAGNTYRTYAFIRQNQSAATAVGILKVNGFDIVDRTSTFTTAWTGAWTLALRHNGVTAGGTFQWTWAIYKLAGQ